TLAPGRAAFTAATPGDKWGGGVGGVVVPTLPWNAGDKFWIEGAVGEGTPCYVGFCQDGVNGTYQRFNGRNVGAGWALDGVVANAGANLAPSPAAGGVTHLTRIVLPTVWDIAAAVEPYWTPALRTSLFGSYTSWDPGSDGNAIMCSSPNSPVRAGPAGNTTANGTFIPAGGNLQFTN